MEQGTEEWRLARVGRVTASRVRDIIAKTKSGYSTSRANYAAELVAERLTGKPNEGYTSPAMQWGKDCEPLARAAYEAQSGNLVIETGFVAHPYIGMAGASPDGLVSDDGLVEIKCPLTATHLDHLLKGGYEGQYMTQMQFQIACTGRNWCDFATFDPRLPERMQLRVMRIMRDKDYIAMVEDEVRKFLAEIDQTINELNRRFEEA